MAHTLGVKNLSDGLPQKPLYNRFVAGDDHSDIKTLEHGLSLGYMSHTHKLPMLGDSRMWCVTELGLEKLREFYDSQNKQSAG